VGHLPNYKVLPDINGRTRQGSRGGDWGATAPSKTLENHALHENSGKCDEKSRKFGQIYQARYIEGICRWKF
jgi:hypothetical protein